MDLRTSGILLTQSISFIPRGNILKLTRPQHPIGVSRTCFEPSRDFLTVSKLGGIGWIRVLELHHKIPIVLRVGGNLLLKLVVRLELTIDAVLVDFLQHGVVATPGRNGLGLPHLTHAAPHSLIASAASPTRIRLISTIALNLGSLSLLLSPPLTVALATTFPPLSLLVIRGSLGCHPLRNPLRLPRKLIQLKRGITITHRITTNHRLTHPVTLLMQHPLSGLHPKMRPQPRTPMWIRLRRTKIIYRETNFARKTNRLLLPTYR